MRNIPRAVRVLPMNSGPLEFDGESVEEVQRKFFLKTLAERGGEIRLSRARNEGRFGHGRTVPIR